MGSSSVPSNTTQTQMLDPTRQKGLQKALDYTYKWADNYKGQSYPGQRVAALPQEWYTARNLATRMGSRLAEGGITSARRFADGGSTWNYDDTTGGYTNPLTGAWSQNDPSAAATSSYGPQPTTNTAPTGGLSEFGPQPTNTAPAVNTPAATTPAATTPMGATLTAANPTTSGTLTPIAGSVSPSVTPAVVSDYGPAAPKVAAPANTGATNTAATNTAATPTITSAAVNTAATPATTSAGTPTNTGSVAPYLTAEFLNNLATGAALGFTNINPGQISNAYEAGKYTAPTITAGQAKAEKMATPDTWNEDFMRQYMSPYTQGVVDIAKREADRQYQQQLQQQKSQATASGAFGGYRQGVVEAEGARNQAQLLNDIQTKGMQDAYARAIEQFNADRQALMSTGQFNAAQANQIALSNAQNKLAADQATAQYGLSGYQASEAAKQAQNQAYMNAQQQNVANALSAKTLGLNAVQQAMTGAQGLASLETQYQNAGLNSARLQADIAATKQAYDQAILNDALAAWEKLQGTDLEKAKTISSLIGMAPNVGGTQVKVST